MAFINRKGQVTIPKRIREALGLTPGSRLDVSITDDRQIVIRKATTLHSTRPDRFDRATGSADIHWRTDELMKLLRN